MTARLLAELAAIVGAAHVLRDPPDLASYDHEYRGQYPGRALAVVRPGCRDEVAAVVKACARHRVALVPQGGNTGLVGASTADDSGTELLLSLRRMRQVRQVDVDDDSLTVEAGCTVAEVQAAAAAHDRLFALSLASEGSATIGGVLATNAGGEQALRYGVAREQVLGLEVVLADGRIWHGLSSLRKDNTGYDLRQLFIGAEGTLGIITAATLRLRPSVRQRCTVWAGVPTPAAAVALLRRLHEALGERVTAFELVSATALQIVLAHPLPGMRAPLATDAAWHVLFEVCETSQRLDPGPVLEDTLADAMAAAEVLDAVRAESQAQAQALWALREHLSEAQRREGPSIKHDIAVPVSRIPAFLAQAGAALQARVPGIRIAAFGHVGDGNLHYNQSKPLQMPDDAFRALAPALHALVHGLAVDLGGTISAEHGIGRQKQAELLQFKPPVAIELMQRLKQALDPQITFNPGRLLPRPPALPHLP